MSRVALAMFIIYLVAAAWLVLIVGIVVATVLASRVAVFFIGYFLINWWSK